jgi:hypothetical protein
LRLRDEWTGMEETSLEDFAAAASEPTSDSGDPGTREETPEGADREADGPADDGTDDESGTDDGGRPAPESTAAWSTAGEPCAACGEPSPWRWAQAGAMVCPDCKEW